MTLNEIAQQLEHVKAFIQHSREKRLWGDPERVSEPATTWLAALTQAQEVVLGSDPARPETTSCP